MDDPSASDDVGPALSDERKDGDMIESYDKHSLIVHDAGLGSTIPAPAVAAAGSPAEPHQGMEFDSEDAARAFYYAYAALAGFRVRISRCQRSMRDNSIICRRFVCSREGFCPHKNTTAAAAERRQRATTRIGCNAMLVTKKQPASGKWLVSKFIREHNHKLAPVCRMIMTDYTPSPIARKNSHTEEKDSSADEEGDEDEEDPSRAVVAAVPSGNPELEPCEGMQFPSEEAALSFYYAYAEDAGFTVRISKCRRARDGTIICRRFVCSKEGYYVRKFGRTKRSRALTRVGCLARFVVKRLDSGSWVIANFEKQHNHPPFVGGQELNYQRPMPTRHDNNGACASLPASSGLVLNRADTEPQNSEVSVAWRFNKLQQEGIRFAEEGATSVEIFNVAMLALREATQKVVAAKCNVVMAPSVDSLVSSSSHGFSTDQDSLALANSSGNQGAPSNQQCSDYERQTASSNRDMLVQQPMNLALVSSGQPNNAGQVPSDISLPNDPAVHRLDNQEINVPVPVPVQKEHMPSENSLDENGSVSSGMPEGRQQKYKMSVDDMENFITAQDHTEGNSKQDGIETQTQVGANNLSNVAIAQRARRERERAAQPRMPTDDINVSRRTQLQRARRERARRKMHELEDAEENVRMETVHEESNDHDDSQSQTLYMVVPYNNVVASTTVTPVEVHARSVDQRGQHDPQISEALRIQQDWNMIGMGQPGSNTGSGSNSANVALSKAHIAALQAVAVAFNVPTTGATTSSALRQFSEMSPHHQPVEAPKIPTGPNPLVHAAAIAAGARIAPPSVAASLIKAVQSRNAIHIRSGGSPVPRVRAVRKCGGDSLSTLLRVHQTSNIDYLRTEEPQPPSMPPITAGGIAAPGSHHVDAAIEYSGI